MPVDVECKLCGDVVSLVPAKAKKRKYCSRSCQAEAQKKRITKNCKNCGDEMCVRPSRKGKKYCSKRCYERARGNIMTAECVSCKQMFSYLESQRENAKYCSVDCMDKKVTVKCANCGEQTKEHAYRVKQTERHYCDQECYLEGHRGENHHCWKGGVERGPQAVWDRIRKIVLKQDGEQCIKCGILRGDHKNEYDQDLHVDHITPLSEFDDWREAHKFSNLQTLCVKCHQEKTINERTTHNQYDKEEPS